MMLTFVDPGRSGRISRIAGKDDMRQFLSNLGFVTGAEVTVITRLSGNLILNIKNSRVAIDQSMARRIFVEEATA